MSSADRAPDYAEQLVVISAELDRQLANVSSRQANAVTRASIVLAASGVTVFVAPTLTFGWGLVPALFSLISAGLALGAIRLWRSQAARLDRNLVASWLHFTPAHLQWRVLLDKLDELAATQDDLNRKNEYFTASTHFLVASWVLSLTVALLISPLIS